MNLLNSTVLVTGGAGFIGSFLCERLISMNARVVCVDNLSQGTKKNLEKLIKKPNFKFIKTDCNDFRQIGKVFKSNKIDYVFHYAATVGVKRTLENPLLVLKDIEGIRNILHLAHMYKVKKVVFASSSEVYGEPIELPETENSKLCPDQAYALVKLIGEKYCQAYWKEYGLPVACLRFFNVYGPRQNNTEYGFVIGIFINQVLNNIRPTVYGDGKMTRDFVYIDDNINASIKVIENDEANGQVLNIGTGNTINILDLAQLIIKLAGKNLRPEFVPGRKSEIFNRCPDISKMKKILKYKPKFSLQEGLKSTLEWYDQNKQWQVFK